MSAANYDSKHDGSLFTSRGSNLKVKEHNQLYTRLKDFDSSKDGEHRAENMLFSPEINIEEDMEIIPNHKQ